MTELVVLRVALAPACRSTVESILAHFDATQARRAGRNPDLHETALAARAVAGARCLSALRRPAHAEGGSRLRRLARRAVAARAPPWCALEPGARAALRGEAARAAAPRLDRAGPGYEPPVACRRPLAAAIRLHPARADRR